MRFNYLPLILLAGFPGLDLKASNSLGYRPTISIWQTDNPGISGSNQIQLPLVHGTNYNFTVNWGDGTSSIITAWDDIDKTHTYPKAGNYTVTMKGHFPVLRFNNSGDRQKILNIKQWGSNVWSSFVQTFKGCVNLQITTSDAPVIKNPYR